MAKKKTILDILEDTKEMVEENKISVDKDLKRQTYCITSRNRELLRQVSFHANINKQDLVNMALESYFQKNYESIYRNVLEAE